MRELAARLWHEHPLVLELRPQPRDDCTAPRGDSRLVINDECPVAYLPCTVRERLDGEAVGVQQMVQRLERWASGADEEACHVNAAEVRPRTGRNDAKVVTPEPASRCQGRALECRPHRGPDHWHDARRAEEVDAGATEEHRQLTFSIMSFECVSSPILVLTPAARASG